MNESDLLTLINTLTKDWLWMLLGLIFGLMMKDAAANIAKGAMLYFFNKDFTVGDHVVLDNEDATIIRIGWFTTVFQLKTGRGMVWRYVANNRIPYLNLKKVIIPQDKIDDLKDQ